MKRTIAIRIKGKVQGVFFRASAKEQADRLGITGIARNDPDGTLYIEATGNDDSLKTFVEWCKVGPPRAQVENCGVGEMAEKKFEGFKIDRGT